MDKKRKQALQRAFAAPPAARREAFLKNFPYPKAGRLDFWAAQLGYIRKRYWLAAALAAAAAFALIRYAAPDAATLGLVSAALPFLSLLAVGELQRSRCCNMGELEMACKYNLGQVTLARLAFAGAACAGVLLALLAFFTGGTGYGVWRTALYLVTPFLLCAFLSLWLANRAKSRDMLFFCGGVTGLVSLGVGAATLKFELFYTLASLPAWNFAFFILVALLVWQVRNLIKQTEELPWNSTLTA